MSINQIPTIGRIVTYNTTKAEREALGTFNCNVSDQLPAVVVGTWGNGLVNLKVMIDGNTPDWWRTSVSQFIPNPDIDNEEDQSKEGLWEWPQRA